MYCFSSKPEDSILKPFAVCSPDTNKKSNDEMQIFSNSSIDDPYDPCTVFKNECMNNLNICLNLYEKSTDIFNSMVPQNSQVQFTSIYYRRI